jgi:protein-tyrosine phosphatase
MHFLECNKKTLIHCKSGTERSAVIMVAHVAKKCDMTLEQAHEYVGSMRTISKLHNKYFYNLQWVVLRDIQAKVLVILKKLPIQYSIFARF